MKKIILGIIATPFVALGLLFGHYALFGPLCPSCAPDPIKDIEKHCREHFMSEYDVSRCQLTLLIDLHDRQLSYALKR